jgi:hypothetical protein
MKPERSAEEWPKNAEEFLKTAPAHSAAARLLGREAQRSQHDLLPRSTCTSRRTAWRWDGDADVVITIYFDPDLLRAVRLKAASLDASISNIVNEAARRSLSEDAADLDALEKRRREP